MIHDNDNAPFEKEARRPADFKMDWSQEFFVDTHNDNDRFEDHVRPVSDFQTAVTGLYAGFALQPNFGRIMKDFMSDMAELNLHGHPIVSELDRKDCLSFLETMRKVHTRIHREGVIPVEDLKDITNAMLFMGLIRIAHVPIFTCEIPYQPSAFPAPQP